jgi:hypothetical protein
MAIGYFYLFSYSNVCHSMSCFGDIQSRYLGVARRTPGNCVRKAIQMDSAGVPIVIQQRVFRD